MLQLDVLNYVTCSLGKGSKYLRGLQNNFTDHVGALLLTSGNQILKDDCLKQFMEALGVLNIVLKSISLYVNVSRVRITSSLYFQLKTLT